MYFGFMQLLKDINKKKNVTAGAIYARVRELMHK